MKVLLITMVCGVFICGACLANTNGKQDSNGNDGTALADNACNPGPPNCNPDIQVPRWKKIVVTYHEADIYPEDNDLKKVKND